MPANPLSSRPQPQMQLGALDEIRKLVGGDLPPFAHIAAPSPQLGDFSAVWRWLASPNGRPGIRHPRVALFMAAHGAFPERQTGLARILSDLKEGKHAVSPLARAADADLQVYELDLGLPSGDFRTGKALDEKDAAQALAYGMMAVQPGIDLLLLSALNPVATDAAREIGGALAAKADPFDTLLRFGGFDIAAMTGAIVAARLARIPVLLDGAAAEVSAAILQELNPDAVAHTRNSSSIISERTALPSPCFGVMLIPLLKSIAQAG